LRYWHGLASFATCGPPIVRTGHWLLGKGQEFADSRVPGRAARLQLDRDTARILAEGAAWLAAHPDYKHGAQLPADDTEMIAILHANVQAGNAEWAAWLAAHPAS